MFILRIFRLFLIYKAMKTIKIAYNNNEDLNKLISIIGNRKYEVIAYNENKYKDKKKAFSLKNKFGAKMLPFIIIEGPNDFLKVFYQESGNSLENFRNYLYGVKSINLDPFKEFIQYCRDNDIPLDTIHRNIDKLYLNKI